MSRGLLQSLGLVFCITAAVKLLGIVREQVMAWAFGTGPAVEIFVIAAILPSYLVNLITSPLSTAALPVLVAREKLSGWHAACALVRILCRHATAWSSAAVVLLVVLAPFYLPRLGSSLAGPQHRQCLIAACILFISVPASILAALFTAALHARSRFFWAALAPGLLAAGPICLMILLNQELGVYSIALGVLLGCLLQAALLGRQVSCPPCAASIDSKDDLQRVRREFMAVLGGSALIGTAPMIDNAMAAMLGAGHVPVLAYGGRVVLGLTSFLVVPLSSVIFPALSKLVTESKFPELKKLVLRASLLTFAVCSVLSVLVIFFSNDLTRILFERGKFSALDTRNVAAVQIMYALQIPFYVSTIILVRVISAFQKNYWLLISGGLSTVLNIALNYLLMYRLGVKGIALSTSLVYLLSFALILGVSASLIHKKLRGGYV